MRQFHDRRPDAQLFISSNPISPVIALRRDEDRMAQNLLPSHAKYAANRAVKHIRCVGRGAILLLHDGDRLRGDLMLGTSSEFEISGNALETNCKLLK